MREKWNIPYPVLIARVHDKELASATLPMLNRVVAWPTLVFVDKQGKVRHIHTGFNRPGTGQAYYAFLEEFEQILDSMLAE
jgi:hypothetical protein